MAAGYSRPHHCRAGLNQRLAPKYALYTIAACFIRRPKERPLNFWVRPNQSRQWRLAADLDDEPLRKVRRPEVLGRKERSRRSGRKDLSQATSADGIGPHRRGDVDPARAPASRCRMRCAPRRIRYAVEPFVEGSWRRREVPKPWPGAGRTGAQWLSPSARRKGDWDVPFRILSTATLPMDFGSLLSTLAVLCTQQRWCSVPG